ncbi:ATP-binding protein [Dissulfurispira sp.]|uniref:ATP-binding protein n=1 Tax=Dissulfurispira sp. TaxID=2817609 RepID=UPI002FD9CCDE
MTIELFIIIILSIAVIFFVFRLSRISKSIKEISGFLKEMSSGNLDARLFPKGKGGLDGIVMDIASLMEKTKTRLDFAETEMQRMEAILRGMSDGVLITDVRGMVILANQPFRSLMSVNDDIEGKQIMEVLRNAQLIDIFRRTLELKSVVSDEIIVSRPHKDMHLIATAVPVYSGNLVTGTVLTLHDITRLKQLEEMRKDFVANVSHEIKTPITAIKGFAETLLDGAMDDKENAVRFLGMIKSHSERLNSLVDDLLTLSRIELGDIPIKKTEVSVENVIDTVFMTLKEKADRKGLYLKKTIPDGTQTIYADKDKLIQVILNLVDNGIKFTEKGGVTVGIDETGGRITIYVHDTGIGVSPNHLHRLGERFYRVDRARSRELGGTGLGLAIVKHLVGAHGWNMRIESETGKGTMVNIIIDRYL